MHLLWPLFCSIRSFNTASVFARIAHYFGIISPNSLQYTAIMQAPGSSDGRLWYNAGDQEEGNGYPLGRYDIYWLHAIWANRNAGRNPKCAVHGYSNQTQLSSLTHVTLITWPQPYNPPSIMILIFPVSANLIGMDRLSDWKIRNRIHLPLLEPWFIRWPAGWGPDCLHLRLGSIIWSSWASWLSLYRL